MPRVHARLTRAGGDQLALGQAAIHALVYPPGPPCAPENTDTRSETPRIAVLRRAEHNAQSVGDNRALFDLCQTRHNSDEISIQVESIQVEMEDGSFTEELAGLARVQRKLEERPKVGAQREKQDR